MIWMGTCGGDGGMWQGVGHVAGVVAGCGGMWQGVGACGRVDVCGRGSAYSIDGDMWQGVGAC